MEFTLAGGLIALTITGLSWSLTGVVMGSAPRRGVDPALVLLLGAVLAIAVMAICLAFNCPDFSFDMLGFAGLYLLSGILNFTLLQLMSLAMRNGPNGVVWGIVQSGVIWPFATGVIFFNDIFTATSACGMVLLLVALTLFGIAKPPGEAAGTADRKWLIFAILSFVFCGIQITVSNIPSYFDLGRNIDPIYRTTITQIGIMLAVLIYHLYRHIFFGFRYRLAMFASPALWGFVLMLQGFGLISSYFLLFPGLDALARSGIGSASYPLLISACLIGFFLYSTLILREKNRPIQYVAFVCCLLGVVAICLKTDPVGELIRQAISRLRA